MSFFLYTLLILLSVANFIDTKVSIKDVTYGISTRSNRKLQNFVTPINSSKLNSRKPVIFIIHGWTNTGKKPWIQNLTSVLLERSDCNIVTVDWRKPANESFSNSAKNVKEVGEIIGDAIVRLVKKNNVPLKQMHIIGQSLGAHIAGIAGQTVKSKLNKSVPWITGLDPAGPLFETPILVPKNERLSEDDAKVVEVVHTDGGLLGFHSPIGTIDFYPNGGLFIQPNCSSSVSKQKFQNYVYCSHEKSSQYYTKALKHNGYRATKCSSWIAYQSNLCKNNEKAIFGSLKPPKQKGKFYFKITAPVLNVV